MTVKNQFLADLDKLNDTENALKTVLKTAEVLLSDLFSQRESLIRSINKEHWDNSQYKLDDLQQSLSDICEDLDQIKPLDSIINFLIAP